MRQQNCQYCRCRVNHTSRRFCWLCTRSFPWCQVKVPSLSLGLPPLPYPKSSFCRSAPYCWCSLFSHVPLLSQPSNISSLTTKVNVTSVENATEQCLPSLVLGISELTSGVELVVYHVLPVLRLREGPASSVEGKESEQSTLTQKVSEWSTYPGWSKKVFQRLVDCIRLFFICSS